jgi:hypothetical protein
MWPLILFVFLAGTTFIGCGIWLLLYILETYVGKA